MPELHELTALDLAAAYRRGDTTPREVVDHLLARVDAHADTVGAFVTVTHEAARAAADRAGELLREHADGAPLLLGVPTAVKDLNQTAGVRTTFGSAATADTVPAVSDEVVLRMEAAGLVSLGKTNTPEFGAPCYTEPEVAPPARTPYDLDRSAGGSSGGAAAAVAAGLLPDRAGLRRRRLDPDPGQRVRAGRLQAEPGPGQRGARSTATSAGCRPSGPLATTVRDAAAMLDAMAGPAVGDPTWAAPLPAGRVVPRLVRPPTAAGCGSRGSPTPPISDGTVEPDVLAGYERAAGCSTSWATRSSTSSCPCPTQTVQVFELVWSVGSASWPLDRAAREASCGR